MKQFQIVLYFFFLTSVLFAQPSWIAKTPEGYLHDFYTGKGFSNESKADAFDKALASAIAGIVNGSSINVSAIETYKSDATEQSDGKRYLLNKIDKIVKEITITGESSTIRGLRQVEEYYDAAAGGYNAWVLVSIPKKNPLSPPSSFSPIWRSLLLPGWGQLYKEQSFKGVSFMTLTIGGIAGGLVFSQLSDDAAKNALAARTQPRRDYFNQDKKDNASYSTICFIAGGLFYAWNVVDAIIMKQENLYVRLQTDKDSYGVNLGLAF